MDIYAETYKIVYYTVFQFKLIFPYWFAGVVAGSIISVYLSSKISSGISGMCNSRYRTASVLVAAVLGAASPVCMYGTVPLIVSLGRKGIPQYILAAFMVSSILINPNLFIASFALGAPVAIARLCVCIIIGVVGGIFVLVFYKNKSLFNFDSFKENVKCSCKTPSIKVFLSDLNRGVTKTAPYFIFGIVLTALFDRLIPTDALTFLFGGNVVFGILMSASLGVPVYVCGGGTIPLLKLWMDAGMSMGSAMPFMISGPATKLTNLSAVKMILGIRNFIIYIAYNIIFAILAGYATDLSVRVFGL